MSTVQSWLRLCNEQIETAHLWVAAHQCASWGVRGFRHSPVSVDAQIFSWAQGYGPLLSRVRRRHWVVGDTSPHCLWVEGTCSVGLQGGPHGGQHHSRRTGATCWGIAATTSLGPGLP